MAEQTFRSPGFFEQEIDLSARKQSPTGTPAGIIGTALRGPAFVPVTVGSFADFETKFGGLDPDRFGPYAVREFLKHRKAVTYMRVLGAGSNESSTEMGNTSTLGIVKNAGFSVQTNDGIDAQLVDGQVATQASMPGADASADDLKGGVQFLAAQHQLRPLESEGFPSFTDSDSINVADSAGDAIGLTRLIRASILVASGSRFFVVGDEDGDGVLESISGRADAATAPADQCTADEDGLFKLVLTSSAGADFGLDEGIPGMRVFKASLNPASPNYVAKVLNTDPARFQEYEHVLWCDYAVENELATAGLRYTDPTDADSGVDADGDGVNEEASKVPITTGIAILRGSAALNGDVSLPDITTTTPAVGGQNQWRQLFGRFDTRYRTATTPMIVSKPYGATEYDLFRFEALVDGS